MEFYHKLYLSDDLKEKKSKIIKKLKANKWQIEKYLIVLSKNVNNHLEIFNSVLLLQKVFEKEELFVVGITSNMERAYEFVEIITQEVYDNTQGTDIKSYIMQKQKEFEKGNV